MDAFGRVAGAVRQSTGPLVIADGLSLDLRLFTDTGEPVKRVGRRGDGPGEFRTILSLRRCAGDTSFVYDPARLRVSVFGPDGALSRIIDVRATVQAAAPPYDFFCSRNGVLAFVHRAAAPPPRPGPHRPIVAITVIHRDGARVPLGTFPSSERYFDGSQDFPRPFGKVTSVAMASDAMYVGTGNHLTGHEDQFEIPVYSLQGAQVRTVRGSLPRRRVTAAQIAGYVEDQVARRRGRGDQRTQRQFYRSLQYPETLPAYGRLLVDPMDNLWVEEYRPPGDSVGRWHVYGPTGWYVGAVNMPEGFDLLEAGRDYVLGVWRNPDQVEFVRLYALSRPGADRG